MRHRHGRVSKPCLQTAYSLLKKKLKDSAFVLNSINLFLYINNTL